MTNEEITEVFKRLKDIQSRHSEDFQAQANSLYQLQQDMGLNLPHTLEYNMQKKVFNLTSGIHIFLQTNMMLNACVSAKESGELAKQSCSSAKRSCFWAAVAAIAACISTLLALSTVFRN